jgi:hypothetical protein
MDKKFLNYLIHEVNLENNGWNLDHEDSKSKIKVYHKVVDSMDFKTKHNSFKIENIILNYSMEVVWETIYNVENRKKWRKF